MKVWPIFLVLSLLANIFFIVSKSNVDDGELACEETSAFKHQVEIEKENLPKPNSKVAKLRPAKINTEEIKSLGKKELVGNELTKDEQEFLESESPIIGEIKIKRQEVFEKFFYEEINLNQEEGHQIMSFLNATENKVDEYLQGRMSKFHKKYGQKAIYFLNTEDQYEVAKIRLKRRKELKRLMGSKQFKKFKNFIGDYNAGVSLGLPGSDQPFQPIDF